MFTVHQDVSVRLLHKREENKRAFNTLQLDWEKYEIKCQVGFFFLRPVFFVTVEVCRLSIKNSDFKIK